MPRRCLYAMPRHSCYMGKSEVEREENETQVLYFSLLGLLSLFCPTSHLLKYSLMAEGVVFLSITLCSPSKR